MSPIPMVSLKWSDLHSFDMVSIYPVFFIDSLFNDNSDVSLTIEPEDGIKFSQGTLIAADHGWPKHSHSHTFS